MTTEQMPSGYYTSATPTLSDWGQVLSFTPSAYFAPASVEDLQELLTALLHAQPSGKSLRFLGGQHSCSDIFKSETVIDTSQLPLEFDVSPSADGSSCVVASAYMHAHEFLFRAAKNGLSLTVLGGTDAQTLAGLISTNTAGATAHASVYELVEWVEYLTTAPDGQSIILKRVGKAEPDFDAVICSLGCIGFLVRVAFNLVEQRYFNATSEVKQLSDVLDDVAKTCAAHDFWRIEWIAKADWGLFWHADQLTGKGSDPLGDYPDDTSEATLRTALQFDDEVLGSGPYFNVMLEAVYNKLKSIYVANTSVGPMRHMIPIDRKAQLHVAMAEWSFNPVDIARVMQVCRTYFDANKWPNLATEIQCTLTDSYHMSPWNWPGLPYIVKFNFQYLTDFLSDDEKADMIKHLQGLWNAIEAAGIPFKAHWGKINFLTPEKVARDYQLAAFLPHIQPLFLNNYLKSRLIGP